MILNDKLYDTLLCLIKFLYEPYIEYGGNGTVLKLKNSADALKIFDQYQHILEKTGEMENDS